MSKKTTLNEIAAAAGLSIATVDRVINGRGGVSPRAEARVLEWANKLNLDRIAFRRHMRALRVALLVPPPQDPFFIRLRDAFTRMNTVMSEIKITGFMHYIDRTNSASIRDKLTAIEGSYDGVVICAPADAKLNAQLRKLSKRIPVVTIITDLPDSGRIGYVGPDNYRMGRVAGELMGRFLGEKGGDIIAMTGLREQHDQATRRQGFEAVLKERFPQVKIVDGFVIHDSPENAAVMTLRSLAAHPNVVGIYNPTAGNVGIRKAIEKLGLVDRITIITHELTPNRRDMLRDGYIDAVIDQNPDIEARRAMEMIAEHYGRYSPDTEDQYTPFSLFIRENI